MWTLEHTHSESPFEFGRHFWAFLSLNLMFLSVSYCFFCSVPCLWKAASLAQARAHDLPDMGPGLSWLGVGLYWHGTFYLSQETTIGIRNRVTVKTLFSLAFQWSFNELTQLALHLHEASRHTQETAERHKHWKNHKIQMWLFASTEQKDRDGVQTYIFGVPVRLWKEGSASLISTSVGELNGKGPFQRLDWSSWTTLARNITKELSIVIPIGIGKNHFKIAKDKVILWMLSYLINLIKIWWSMFLVIEINFTIKFYKKIEESLGEHQHFTFIGSFRNLLFLY